MLDDAGDDVPTALRTHRRLGIHQSGALDREIVALGGTAGPDDLFGSGSDQACGLLTSAVHAGFRPPTEGVVSTRRVPVGLGEVREHRLDHAGVGASRGCVVHVNWKVHRRGTPKVGYCRTTAE